MKPSPSKKLLLQKIKISSFSKTVTTGPKEAYIRTVQVCTTPGDTVCFSDFVACNTVLCA
ncbi:hypothetical protein SAMN04488505_10785 [Chitinophaga rupis]|jgi:hypothetical protein|uniref:Uncharacterized protein n=1 Tax=Chitinophaga rupis TaxID=573321 RepID=A0A1H8CEI9_9BACT|nr:MULTISPECIES: hypothetical protein [Chitinophaga]SEM93392.1 hypothetical protein SAMN04488505_10785 [Chitinophaga rupis]